LISPGILERTKRALVEAGLKPSKRLGQNFVVDQSLIDCMLDAAELSRADTVLEIGAGIGTLTRAIAGRAGRVIAMEKDAAAAEYLGRDAPGNVEVLHCDALEAELPGVDKVVSNLPYSISTPLTFRLLSQGRFRLAVLTYQKEVADRMVAGPGGPEYSRLSVACQLRAEVEVIGTFPKSAFFPAPKVESAVVRMRPRHGAMDGRQWAWMEDTLKAMFSQRKRTLRKALGTYGKIKRIGAPHLPGIGEELMGRRVFELSPRDFMSVAEELSRIEGNRLGV
jgi:16S rRNA (adenine1518-N6/adenine1519-N6)-dimethyltransferase